MQPKLQSKEVSKQEFYEGITLRNKPRNDYYGWYEIPDPEAKLLWIRHMVTGEELVVDDMRLPILVIAKKE